MEDIQIDDVMAGPEEASQLIMVEEDSVVDNIPEVLDEKREVETRSEAEPISGDELVDEPETELREELMEVEAVEGGKEAGEEPEEVASPGQNVESPGKNVESPGRNVEDEMVEGEEQQGEEILEGDELEEVDTADGVHESEVWDESVVGVVVVVVDGVFVSRWIRGRDPSHLLCLYMAKMQRRSSQNQV